jgi:molecular chaperone GrpE
MSERREAGVPFDDDVDDAAGFDDEPGAAQAVERDVADIEQLVRERDDLLELSRRLQADFENYRKRMLREQTSVVERATEGLVEQLLPVLDAFSAAAGHLDDDGADAAQLLKGVRLAAQELHAVLGRNGLEVIDTTGVPFDPHEHDAVAQEPGEGEPVVGDVLRSGYRLKGRVLRPAMVKVTHPA